MNANDIREECRPKRNNHDHCHEEHSWAAFDYERAVPKISEKKLELIGTDILEPVFRASQRNASLTGNIRSKVQPKHASRI